MIVVKFGGTSLAGTERMRAAARIVAAHCRDQSVVCVVSAMAGVTDSLIRTIELATRGEITRGLLAEIRAQHQQTLTGLTTITTTGTVPITTSRFTAAWDALEADLARLIETSYTSRAARMHAIAAFSGWGERLAVQLFATALAAEGIAAIPFESEPVIMIERPGTGANDPPMHAADVPWERLAPSVAATRAMLVPQLAEPLRAGKVPVLPGYLARTPAGLVTTLGRNGSDYSAAIIGAALGAEALYLYSDVAGIHRADPRVVPEAELLPTLTYADAAEMAALGARVLHPATLRPLAAAGIPLRLRSSRSPHAPGTNIGPAALVRAAQPESNAWVVMAHPLKPDHPLLGKPTDWQPGLVEVTGLFLDHTDLEAQEDDHLSLENISTGRGMIAGQPGDGPVSGALALLTSSPRPIGLALSARRVSAVVPASEAAATQRHLYIALTHAGTHQATGPDFPGEWRRMS